MSKLRLSLVCLTSGLIWSVSFLLVVEVLHQTLGASTALILAWPIKIGWSTAHTALSRWRGSKSVKITLEGGMA